MKIGFIGTGEISRSMVLGLDRSDFAYDGIIVSRRSERISAELAAICGNVRVLDDNQQIVDEADTVILAVLPEVAEEVIAGLRFRSGQHVISVIAALTFEHLKDMIDAEVTITRANPLPVVAIGMGATAILPAEETTAAIFGAMGTVIPASSEAEYDALVVSTTFMETFFGMQSAMIGWLQAKGIAEKDAQAYISAIFHALGKTAIDQSGKTMEEIRKSHTTKGGLNEQVYRMFRQKGGMDALIGGIDSVHERVRQASPSE
jgi:pyrroline-5-carboxylate reductase